MKTKLFVFVPQRLVNRSKRPMRRIIFLRAVFLLLLCFHLVPASLKASGPWKGQVVASETKRPVQGVVVLAVWYQYWPEADDHGTYGYLDSEEAITDGDGQFTLKARSFMAADPFILEQPEIHLSKPGYGRWRFQSEETGLKLDVRERRLSYEKISRQFDDTKMVIELLPLKMRQ